MDAGRTRHVAWRRARQTRPDARLPALDRLAATTRIGPDCQHLPGPPRCAGRRFGARPPRPLRTSTISSSATTRSTRRRTRFAMPRRTSRRSKSALFKKAVCKIEARDILSHTDSKILNARPPGIASGRDIFCETAKGEWPSRARGSVTSFANPAFTRCRIGQQDPA